MKYSFAGWARFVTRRPLAVIIITVLITIGLGYGLTGIKVDADMTDDIPPTLPEKVFYDQVGEIFPADDFLIVAITDSTGVFTSRTLSEVHDWSEAFSQMRGVKNVLSLSTAGLITGNEEGLFIEDAMPIVPRTGQEISTFRDKVEKSDITGGLIGSDGKSTAIIITVKEGIDTEPLPRVELRIPLSAVTSPELLKSLDSLDGVLRIYSPADEKDLVDAEDTYLVNLAADKKGMAGILLEPEEGADTASLTDQAGAIAAGFGGSARYSEASAPFYDRITALLDHLPKQTDGKVYVSGAKAVSGIVGRLLISDLALLFPIVIAIIAIVLFISFRSARGVFLPLGNVVISVIWAMGLMGLLGQPLSMATMILPIILIAVGTAYTIHVINRFYEELTHEKDKKNALEAAVSHVALPVFLAGITTFIGFFSLVASRISALRMFGILSALGILFALLLSLTFTPAVMSLLGKPKSMNRKTKESRFAGFLGSFGSAVISHPVRTALISGITVLFFTIFIPRVAFETNTVNSFKKGSEIREASTYLNDNFTGITVMTIIAHTDEEGGILDPAVLQAMDGLQTRLESLRLSGRDVVGPEDPRWEKGSPIVGGSQSIVTFIKGINKALNADNPAFDKVPDEITPQDIQTERYRFKDGVLQEYDYDTDEYLGEYLEGTDFTVEKGFAYLDLYGIKREINLETGLARDLIPGRIYAGQLVFQYENSGDPQDIEAFLDTPRTNARINVFIKTASSTLIGEIQKDARDYISGNFPETAKADITGLSNLTLAVLRLLVESQISSVLASLIIVFLFISLMSGSMIEGLFAIIPLSSALIINFGLMGLAGIPIDISTATIASIGIGIGIDYTLHFLERLKASICPKNPDLKQAVIQTMKTTGKGIFFNALAVAAGFSALMLSQLRGNIFMGVLMALIMLSSSLFAVTLLPALLAIFNPAFLKKNAIEAACDETVFTGSIKEIK